MLNHLSQTEQAYIAGFLDGDGSIYARAKPNPTYRYGFQIAPYIAFFQSTSSKEPFEKLCALIGCGRMRERKDGILEYVIGKSEDVKNILDCVAPFVIMKREQVEVMRRIIELKTQVASQQDFQQLLDLVDSFRELNYSKNRKKRVLTP
jgi:hypothetical protein